jgi:hypothetical protein
MVPNSGMNARKSQYPLLFTSCSLLTDTEMCGTIQNIARNDRSVSKPQTLTDICKIRLTSTNIQYCRGVALPLKLDQFLMAFKNSLICYPLLAELLNLK